MGVAWYHHLWIKAKSTTTRNDRLYCNKRATRNLKIFKTKLGTISIQISNKLL